MWIIHMLCFPHFRLAQDIFRMCVTLVSTVTLQFVLGEYETVQMTTTFWAF